MPCPFTVRAVRKRSVSSQEDGKKKRQDKYFDPTVELENLSIIFLVYQYAVYYW